MKPYTLDIHRSDRNHSVIRLHDANSTYEKVSDGVSKIQPLLVLTETIFAEHKITPEDIGHVTVHTGPGSFTGLRIGLSVARIFALLLGIPVNHVHAQDPIGLQYESDSFSK